MEGVEKNFEISGTFVEKGMDKKFRKIVSAGNSAFAKEKVLCLFGSKHNTKRRHIKINDIKEI